MFLPGQAKKMIEKVEEERARFHKFYTGGNWGNVNDYDLCLDGGSHRNPKGGRYHNSIFRKQGIYKRWVKKQKIQEKVKKFIFW